MAEEIIPSTITVTANGSQSIPTTLTQVELGVEIQGQSATDVQKEVAQRSTKLVDLLNSRQVQKLQTTGIRLQPNYQYQNRERRFIGYQGSNKVTFLIANESVGALLDEAVKVGATSIDRISFTATDSAISEAQKQALVKATTAAKAQANTVLNALNLSPQEIVSIHINNFAGPNPRPMMAEMRASSDAESSTPVIGGEQTIQASVTLQIKY